MIDINRLHFRHFLEKPNLTTALPEDINAYLKAHGLPVSKGTLVDATMIHTPGSTMHRDKARDPVIYQTRKGNRGFWLKDTREGNRGFWLKDTRGGRRYECHARRGRHRSKRSRTLREDDQVTFGEVNCAQNIVR